MRLPRKPEKPKPAPSPEDTQEMFTGEGGLPADPEETREYEAVGVVEEEAGEDTAEDAWEGDEPEEWEEPAGEEEIPAEEEELFDEEELESEELEDEEELESEEELEDEAAGEKDGEPEREPRLDRVKARLAELRDRAATLGAGLLRRVADIKLPQQELDGQKVLAVAGAVVVALLVGTAGYLVGKGTGDDLDTARLEGEFAGKRAGAIAGATEGYAAGFKKGRDLAFDKAYSASYRRNYRRAYENAGMKAPKSKNIEVPEP